MDTAKPNYTGTYDVSMFDNTSLCWHEHVNNETGDTRSKIT